MNEKDRTQEKVGKSSTGLLRLCLVMTVSLLNLAFGPMVVGKVKEGNKSFEKGDYDGALKKYTDAQIDRPESPELFFNIGNILYKQRKYAEAEQMFNKAIPQSEPELEAKIYYNIADSKYKQGQLRESIDYYKKALELNPDDEDSKYNIEFVEKKIKEMLSQSKERQDKQKQEQKEQGAGGQGQKGQEEKSQKETQTEGNRSETETPTDVGEKTKGETEAMQEKGKGETEQEEQKEGQRQAGKPEELSKEEAESLLRMMADEEKTSGKPEEKDRSGHYPEVEKNW